MLPPPCRPDDGPGSGLFTLAVPFPASLPTGKSRISQVPWPDDHPVTLRRSTTPDDPLRLAISGASGAAPTRLTMKASSFTISRLTAALHHLLSTLHDGRCRTPCKDSLPAGRLRLCRAGVEPAGHATRGFSSCHPPLQGFAWRDNRSATPWTGRHQVRPSICSLRARTVSTQARKRHRGSTIMAARQGGTITQRNSGPMPGQPVHHGLAERLRWTSPRSGGTLTRP